METKDKSLTSAEIVIYCEINLMVNSLTLEVSSLIQSAFHRKWFIVKNNVLREAVKSTNRHSNR